MVRLIMNIFKLLGITYLGAIYIVYIGMFIIAYLQPDKSILMMIDTKGEADLELFIIIIPSLFLSTKIFYNLIREWIQED
jgi:hypothetical protein